MLAIRAGILVTACDRHHEGRTHLIRGTIGEMERRLASRGFARVHRAALVNIELVVETCSSADGGRELILQDGSTVPVSRRRWSELREALTGR
ncbi:MAG: LytTR family DNA-binding domain-containing protein [Planctomycetota bacterium]